MASSNFGQIPLIDPSQIGKAASADTAFEAIDSMLNGLLTLSANELANPYTIPYAAGDEPAVQKPALRFALVQFVGALSEPFVAYMPAGLQRTFIAQNSTSGGQSVTIMCPGQTGVLLAPGTAAVCFLNGTDVVQPPITVAFGTQPWEVGNFLDGQPTSGQVIMRFIAARTITFPAAFANNQMQAGTAFLDSATFTFNKNGSQVGQATFAAAGTSPSWGSLDNAPVIFNAGDVGTFVAPGSVDANGANLVWNFSGFR